MAYHRWGFAALALVLLDPRAGLAAYPERPITMIVAYAAGGATDVLARALAPFLEKYLGTPFVVVNRGGAGGEVGFSAAARSTPDGYTVAFINTPNFLTIPIERNARYSLDDFEPIANLVDDPGSLNVLASSPMKTVADFVAAAKEREKPFTFSSTGVGGDDHLAMIDLSRLTGIVLTHVPFSGSSLSRSALLGGHVDVGVINVSEVIEYIKSGQVRSLGQMGHHRWANLPDVPTFREQGFDVIMGSERGMAAPKGTPAEIVERLAEAVNKTVADPEFMAIAERSYFPLRYMSRVDYTNWLRDENAKFRKIWAEKPWLE